MNWLFLSICCFTLKFIIGMFSWVRLVVEELRNCFSDLDLEGKFDRLPKGLDEAYVPFQPNIKFRTDCW
jgi:hypothetical protein